LISYHINYKLTFPH